MASVDDIVNAQESANLGLTFLHDFLPGMEVRLVAALDHMEKEGFHDEELLDSLWHTQQCGVRVLVHAVENAEFYSKG